MKTKTKRTASIFSAASLKLLTVIPWLFLWQLASLALSEELLLPSPLKTAEVLLTELLPSKSFWYSISSSILHIGLGFLLGTLAGICLAICAARHKAVYLMLWLPLKLMQSVPVASFVILVLLWIPASGLPTVISFLMVLPILYTHTLTGSRQLDPLLTEMSLLFRVPAWKRIVYLYIPQLLPHVCAACTLAASLAWKSGIAAEIIALSKNSIGSQLYQSKIYLLTPELFAWTFVIVMLSIGCEWLIRFTASRLSAL